MYILFDTATDKMLGYTEHPQEFFGDSVVVFPQPSYWDGSLRDTAFISEGSIYGNLDQFKQVRVAAIKAEAASQIDTMTWRMERARERDIIGAAGETVSEVLSEREAIRAASSRAEAELMAVTTAEQVKAFTWKVTVGDLHVTTRMTVYAFLRRFTNEEAVAVDLASSGETAEAASVRRYMSLVTNALSIDLSLPELRDGVNGLEASGALASGRAAEILDTPIDRTEAPI